MSQWNRLFPINMKNRRHRVCLGNPNTAASVAQAFFPSNATKGKVVIEAFAGKAFVKNKPSSFMERG